MSSNLQHSLTDGNRDLQKQSGCITGLFLLFDRRRFLYNRRIRSHNHNGLSPGQSGNNGDERNNIIQTGVGKNLDNCEKEKQRVSDESSNVSFSSSSRGSFTLALVDCSKTAQPEPSSLEHHILSRNQSQIAPTKHSNSSLHLGKQSLDLCIVIKDSIGKETHELSVRTTTKAKRVSSVVKNVDSPRPPKDAPRFSYDERASRDKWKSATKLKELPRLSLDSRERYTRESASNYLVDNLEHGNCISSQTLDPHQETGSNKRSTSVVEKLMGLEAFPDSNGQIRERKYCMHGNLDTMSTSLRKANESTYNKASGSPKSQLTERNCDSQINAQNTSASVYGEIEKMVTELEFKRCGKELRALKQILEAMGKTKERLENGKEYHASNLEPQTNNHNSNYLNRHMITPIKKTGQPKKFESSVAIKKTAKVDQKHRYSCSSVIPIESVSGLHKLRTKDGVDIRKDLVDNRKAKDLAPRKNHFLAPSSLLANSMDKTTNFKTLKSIQTTKSPQYRNGGNPDSSVSSSTIVSPRLQQKKQTRPTTPPSDSSRARGHLSNLQIASTSPGRKFKPKSPNLRQGDDKLSETRYSSHQGDAISEQSDSNLSWVSQSDIEVTSTERSKESNRSYQHKDQKHVITARSSKDRSNGEATTATFEQPSPVSVLDTAFYEEEPPSPVKKISNAFIDEEAINSDEAEWSLVDLDCSANITRPNPNLSPQFDQEKFESIKYMVQNLRQVNSKHDEVSTDHITFLCQTTKPQHRYITEILLASGILLKDLASSSTIIQLHQSSHLINPNLFLVLEQTKGRIDPSKFSDKIKRKLTFDVVNEILFRILTTECFYDPWISPKKIGLKSLSGRKLLKELCSEMDHLEANSKCSSGDEDDSMIRILREDMMHHPKNLADYNTEVPWVVLDIERLIFKDLIGDIVSGEAARLQSLPTKHCRQLFPM